MVVNVQGKFYQLKVPLGDESSVVVATILIAIGYTYSGKGLYFFIRVNDQLLLSIQTQRTSSTSRHTVREDSTSDQDRADLHQLELSTPKISKCGELTVRSLTMFRNT